MKYPPNLIPIGFSCCCDQTGLTGSTPIFKKYHSSRFSPLPFVAQRLSWTMTYSTRSELLNLVPASHCQVNINSLYIIPIIAVHSIHQELAPYAKQYTPWMILIYGYSLYSLVANAMLSRQVSQRSRTTTTQVPLATEVYPFHRPL